MKISKFVQRSPIVPILLASRFLEGELKKGLAPLGLSVWEALILVAIFFEERPCRPSEIARLLRMDRSQLSQAIRRMLDRDLIQRELVREDARGVVISLKAAGKRSAAGAIKCFNIANELIEKGLSESSSEDIAQSLFRYLSRAKG